MEFVDALLADGAALTLGEIDAALQAAGRRSKPVMQLEVLVEKVPGAMSIVGDRWVATGPLIEGRTFTHALTDAELSSELVMGEPDLTAIEYLTITELVTMSGESVVSIGPDHDWALYAEAGLLGDQAESGLLLPDGSLSGLAGPGLAGVTLESDGELRIVPVAAVDDSGAEAVVATLQQLAQEYESDYPFETCALVLSVCAGNPDAFRTPLPPISELLDRAGLVRRGAFVASAGFDFDAWENESAVRRSAHMFGLDESSARAAVNLSWYVDEVSRRVATLVESATARLEPSTPAMDDSEPVTDVLDGLESPDLPSVSEPVALALRRVADPDVATALLAMTLGEDEVTALPLSLAVYPWRSAAPRGSRPALAWLEGKALERLGQHEAAERAYDSAETLDPSWPLALIELARYASDRGDALRAVGLLDRAGVRGDDDERSFLAPFAAEAPLERNAPCWCGSGRRLKACHRVPPPLPLSMRGSWLHHKAVMFLHEGPWREELLDLAIERSRYWTEPDALYRALSDPLLHDVMLHEGGVFEVFLEERGYLLPDDEREAAQAWIDIDRSVFEVAEVHPGNQMELYDSRTGESHWVFEGLASRTLRPGALVASRMVRCGRMWQLVGGVEPVSFRQRDVLMELFDGSPEPVDVVAALSERFAFPDVVREGGEPEAIWRTLIEVDDIGEFFDDVIGRYEPRGAALVRVVNGVVRATLTLDNGLVRIETFAQAHMEVEIEWLLERSTFVSVVEDEVIPLDQGEDRSP